MTTAKDLDAFRHDYYNLWNAVEIYTGIIAASLPSLRPLFKAALKFSSATPSKTSARSRYAPFASGTGASFDRLKDQRRSMPRQDGYRMEFLGNKNGCEALDLNQGTGPRGMLADRWGKPYDGYCAREKDTDGVEEIA